MSLLNQPIIDIAAFLNRGVDHHQSGNLDQAETCYQKILSQVPNQPDALHLLGVVAHQRGKHDLAVHLIQEAIRNNPKRPLYHNNLAAALREVGAWREAIVHYKKAIQLKPDYAEAAYNLGSVFLLDGDFSQSSIWYEKAIRINPDYVDALSNLAAVYNRSNRPQDALECCQKAVTVNPNCSEALTNMGNAYISMGEPKKAIDCFRKSISSEPVNPEAYSNMGNACHDLGRVEEALSCYRNALASDPAYGGAYNNMGIVLRDQGKLDEASTCFQKAMQLRPDDADAYHNMGNTFKDQGRLNEAMAMYYHAIERNPQSIESYVNLGTVLEDQGLSEEAISNYLTALKIQPDYSKAYSHLVHQLHNLCAWQEVDALNETLDNLTDQALEQGKQPDEMPFLNLARHAEPSLNYKVAKAWSDELSSRLSGVPKFYPTDKQGGGTSKQKTDKITVGYLSNNFKNHPTAHLVQGMFQHHDRERFTVFCYSYGKDDKSSYREKIESTCDRFTDISMFSHKEAAKRIYDDRVDILVDLVGYMKANRLCIPAMRPAPIQVRWLGLAGTTGADFFDYQLTDEIVSPRDHAPFYSEALVYMPDCYQINDNTQVIQTGKCRRYDFGLPQDGFIYCSFSSRYKYDSVMFRTWMNILNRVPGSVLWLLGGNSAAEKNLKQVAESHGVDAKRILFADKIPRDDHLQRLQLADLALDTRIVNGAITTSDALWSGVPLVTLQGRHFASRMSSSILSAAEIPELVTHGLDEYEALAVRLAEQPTTLESIRQKLHQNRLSMPLFDTPRFVRNLEVAYFMMGEIYYSGNTAKGIRVVDLLSDGD